MLILRVRCHLHLFEIFPCTNIHLFEISPMFFGENVIILIVFLLQYVKILTKINAISSSSIHCPSLSYLPFTESVAERTGIV